MVAVTLPETNSKSRGWKMKILLWARHLFRGELVDSREGNIGGCLLKYGGRLWIFFFGWSSPDSIYGNHFRFYSTLLRTLVKSKNFQR